MIDLQTAVGSLMTLILTGGADAAKELFKGMVIKGAEQASGIWREVFEHEPDAYPLADRVAKNPQDESAQQQLGTLLKELLEQRPELYQQLEHIKTGDITADNGSVAAGVISGTTITIDNKK